MGVAPPGFRHIWAGACSVKTDIQSAADLARTILERLLPSRGFGPIDSLAALDDFTTSRAAYIAQRTMYGYVKTRMGTRYPEMFRDDAMAHAVRIATVEHFAACLSDLTIFTTLHALAHAQVDDDNRRAIAVGIYESGLAGRVETDVPEFDGAAALAAFEQRVAFIDWSGTPDNDAIFTRCLESIVRWAPIADELKTYDTEYVRNSVRYAWIGVRKLFFKRLDTGAIAADVAATF